MGLGGEEKWEAAFLAGATLSTTRCTQRLLSKRFVAVYEVLFVLSGLKLRPEPERAARP
jgi:hypothetical protein